MDKRSSYEDKIYSKEPPFVKFCKRLVGQCSDQRRTWVSCEFYLRLVYKFILKNLKENGKAVIPKFGTFVLEEKTPKSVITNYGNYDLTTKRYKVTDLEYSVKFVPHHFFNGALNYNDFEMIMSDEWYRELKAKYELKNINKHSLWSKEEFTNEEAIAYLFNASNKQSRDMQKQFLDKEIKESRQELEQAQKLRREDTKKKKGMPRRRKLKKSKKGKK